MVEKKVPFDAQNNRDSNEPRPPWKNRRLVIIILALTLLLLITGGTAAAVVSSYIHDAPPLDPAYLETVETSYIFDSNGRVVTPIHGEQHRIAVNLDEVPDHVEQAFIAIEDERFYEHSGFDLTANIRAAYANLRAGSIVQGASTISQQLAQNAFLTTETTLERKIQEIYLAIRIEGIYSKEEILEMYLNRVYFGNSAYGIEAAAQTYFDKSVDELEIPEAAMLAGAVRMPNHYNPINNTGAAEERMQSVLYNMKRLGFISESQYSQALSEDLDYAEQRSPDYLYPHYVDYVLHHELINILMAGPTFETRDEAYQAVYTDGLRIYTSLDPSLQGHVEDVLGQEELYPETFYVNMSRAREAISDLPAGESLSADQLEDFTDEDSGVAQPQAAIVVADPATGQIKALGGGREFRKEVDELLRFNHLRQPGSAIKPITTYGPAFEEGTLAGAGSTLDDAPYKKEEQGWFPENFDYKFRGMIPAREALVYSYNIPAVRAYEDLGPQTGAGYAEKMGISTLYPEEVDNLSLTLGGLHRGVTAIDMAQAYSVFANQGVRVDLHTVEKIVDRHGNTLFERSPEAEQILSPQSAFLVNDILQDFVTGYLGGELQIDRPVAAKTGTTDDYRDVYLAAYTPNLVATFWMGYDEPRMGRIEEGWRYSTAFLREVFLKKFEDLEVEEFEEPVDIVRISVCDKSGLRPNDDCHAADTVISDYFIADQVPYEECDMHEDGYYNRPEYIETDERWSSRGGPGRGPEDAEEKPSSPGTELNIFKREEAEGPVDVPDVTGSSQGMAEMRLARVGLEVGTVEHRYHDQVRIGRVIEQNPEPGTTVENGHEVDLIISRGPE